jgi:hypothetical protein
MITILALMMALPFAIFCVLIFAGRKELGWKGVAGFVAVWAAILGGILALRIDRYFFVAAQAILDVVLLSVIYVSFTRLR